jgi:hypothetical protein
MGTFKDWYAVPENRERLNAHRKEMYHSDPSYAEKARQRQREYRQRVAGDKPDFVGLTRYEVCEELGISQWTFNAWRGKNYFPAPTKILGRVSVTENQRNLIGMLAEFHANHGPKLSAAQRQKLQEIVELVHQNWLN